jgi:hypothetical protein
LWAASLSSSAPSKTAEDRGLVQLLELEPEATLLTREKGDLEQPRLYRLSSQVRIWAIAAAKSARNRVAMHDEGGRF